MPPFVYLQVNWKEIMIIIEGEDSLQYVCVRIEFEATLIGECYSYHANLY